MTVDEQPPKFACAVCGRTQTVVMGDRGPVKQDLERAWVGYFMFCAECLPNMATEHRTEGGVRMTLLRMTTGPFAGHRWIVAADLE